jgi:hypothetical protein
LAAFAVREHRAQGYSDGLVLAGALDGGTPTLLASGQPNATFIAVNGTNVYWTVTRAPGGTIAGAIMSAPLDGGIPWVPTDAGADPTDGGFGQTSVLVSTQYDIGWLAVDSANIYWTTQGDQPDAGAVMRALLAGPDAGSPIQLTGDVTPFAVTVDDQFVYWATLSDPGAVRKIPIGGGATITLATGQHTPQGLVVDDKYIYWTNTGTQAASYLDGQIMKALK